MRAVILVAGAVVILAAYVGVKQSVNPVHPLGVIATAVLFVGVVIQRLNGIQRWLSSPTDRRKEHIATLAQQALLEVCENRQISKELLHLVIHVWVIPIWYRRLFPFRIRRYLKNLSTQPRMLFLGRWVIRPTLVRAAAVGLQKPSTSGIRFKKGYGLIGVCIANNDPAEFITLDIANARYRKALKAASDKEWESFGPEVTHSIPLNEARKLSHTYTQVIAKVVTDPESGEALGCVTASLREPLTPAYKLDQDDRARHSVTDLSLALASVL